jgi:GTP-binding protein Era
MINSRDDLLPHIDFLKTKINAQDFLPISALRRICIDELEEKIKGLIPSQCHMFPDDQITDRSERFLAAELVREKITRQLGAELPYQITVEIEEFRAEKKIIHISALILVEREGQKKILIGSNGARIKKVGEQARADMEALFDSKVMLRTWVKVRSGWSDDERALRSLGYMDE